jgi:EAL domain-containing protein (putative c-di-GMP-specific phosphodiesterase class I)/FixJ family two-component response regulator
VSNPTVAAQAATQRAFVVDDDPRANATVCQLLSAIGISPQGFTGPAPFLAEAKANPPDVVVLDLALGHTDAVEVMRQLEVIGFGGDVLLMTGRDGSSLDEIRRVGLRRGLSMLPALRKPFRAADLQQAFSAPPERHGTTPSPAQGDGVAARESRIDLAQALQENWLELWYQPKIDLKSLAICGAEALVRARHPDYGLIPPARLLPEPGHRLYHPLSNFVVRRALSDWSHLAAAGLPLKLAVNLPVAVVQAPEFVGSVRTQLPDDPRFPGMLFEITEDDMVRDPHQIHEVASQLKLYGIALSIDDFGRAYSSLSRLFDLPCVELKIDRSFVDGCAGDQRKHALCETVMNLAHRFDITVCAEGVERIEDLRCLISLGCDTAQGYFFARPMELDAFIERAAGMAIASAAAQSGRIAGSLP